MKAINHYFFSSIDTEEKAYWLGFLFADGYLHVSRHQLALVLADKDKIHLLAFRNALDSRHAITKIDGSKYNFLSKNNFFRFSVRSRQIAEDLLNLGFGLKITRKPRIEAFPDFERHFWRGVIDGDGFMCLAPRVRRKSSRWRIGLTSTKSLCEGFLAFVKRSVNTKTTVRPHKAIFEVSWIGRPTPIRVANLLYEGATIALERRVQIYRQIQEEQRVGFEPQWYSKLSPDDVRRIREQYKPRIVTTSMLAERFHVKPSTIKAVIRGQNWSRIR